MLILILGSVASPFALDLQGSARVYRGRSTTDDDLRSDQDYLNQFYNLSLTESIGPWLRLHLDYLDSNFKTETDTETFERSTRTPSLQLLYDRKNFSAFLQYSQGRNRNTIASQDLDVETALATFRLRQDHGLLYSLRLRQDSNRSLDVSTFGRDIRNRSVNLEILKESATWSAAYKLDRVTLDNRKSSLQLKQLRHEVRGTFMGNYWDDRINLNTSALVSLADQDQEISQGTTLGEPVPATMGLYALDSTPDLDLLDPAPDLVDGNVATPARTGMGPTDPVIQIGGANANQNLGMDLTFIRPVTRIQVHVDAVSDPSVLWEVYASPDNLTWALVTGATSLFDQTFLRYEISFPPTSNRYFKVVNVSLNSQAAVAVTEIQAIFDLIITNTERVESDADRYQFNTGLTIRPVEKMSAAFQLLYNQNRSALGGTVGRKTVSYTYDAGMNFLTSATTNLYIQYRLTDFEQRESPQVFNTEEIYATTFSWDPLDTVTTEVTAYRRLETDRGALLREIESLRAHGRVELLPNLSLESEVSASRTDDPFSGFQQDNYRISGGLESRLTRDLTLSGSLAQEWFDFTGVVDLERRLVADLYSTWRANLFVTITARLGLRDESREQGGQKTVNQRYTLSWSPGTRLAGTLYYQDTDDDRGSRITSSGAGLNYKINPQFTMFANTSFSRTDTGPLSRRKVVNMLAGLTLNF